MMLLRYGLCTLAFIGVFAFPWPYAACLAVIASWFFLPAAFLTGLLYDVLYYAPGAGWMPLGTLVGAVVSLAAYFVRRLIRSRVTDLS